MVFLGQELWRNHRFKVKLTELIDALKRLKLLVVQEASAVRMKSWGSLRVRSLCIVIAVDARRRDGGRRSAVGGAPSRSQGYAKAPSG